ncbi:hypothetical protein [Pseudomonas gingeri]|uniref:hypothetical protein n=1 Tax=Pseudomonas gingeri TaxID=117681 RepID=UPI001C430409|nr:hypothetical protein [Pseudomonas gingeri]
MGNYSDGWSPAQLLEVRLDDQAEPLLYEPYVEESDEHNELDADALDGADATIVVALHRADFAVNDIVQVTLKGRTFEGQRVTQHIEHTVVASELGRTARIPWKNSDILPLIKGRVQVSYVRLRSSAPERGSRSVIVYVVGTQAGSDLPAPRVDDAPGNVLPPEVPFLIVNIREYVGQDPFDRVILVLDGTYASGLPYYREVDDVAGTGDIVFHLQNGPNGDIARLEGGTLLLYYFVENDSGKRRSEELLLDVGEPLASMPPVRVDEAPPPDQVFDPETSLFDARVLVLPNVDIIQNDTVTLYAEGSAAGGSAPPFPFRVTATWVGRELPFTVRRQYILPNLDRSMRLYYTVARDGARTRFSHPFIMKVGSALDLPVPQVLESTITGPDTATINPLHVDSPPVVTIRVEYSPMYPSDNITVHWIGKPGIGTPAIEPKPGLASGQVDFTAPSSAVAAAIGGDCQVSYSVERGGATTPSQTLHVSVSEFNQADLPTPKFYADDVEVTGGTLDVTRTIKMRLLAWPLIAAGQKVWLRLVGQPTNHTLWEDATVSQSWVDTGHAEIPVPASYLNQLDDGSSLSATFKVTFDRSNVEANATTFPVRTVNVQNQPPVTIIPTITSIKNAAGKEIANGTSVVTTTITAAGTAANGEEVEIRDGTTVMRTVTANTSGVWTSPALTVTAKGYSLTARGLYGSNPESAPPRTFTVINEVKPVITGVHTTTGTSVPHNGSTDQRNLTLSGTATPNSTIEVRDGTTVVLSTSVNGSGAWSGNISNLALKQYTLIARIVDGTLSSDSRSFTVRAAEVKPAITGVNTSTGAAVPHNGSTDQRNLTLSGTATPNSTIEVRDGTTVVLSTSVNGSGAWSGNISNLALKQYNLIAKIVGGTLSSDTRSFTVRAVEVKPVITGVHTSTGASVPHNGTTDQRSLTLSGTATPNSTIEVRDGTTVLLSTAVNGSGAWSGHINNLSLKQYNLIARIVGGTLSSDTRSFTVRAAEVKPVITGVHTSTGASVPHNGTTDQRSLTLSGTATPNSTIEVRDGTTVVLSTAVNGSGAWSGHINNLTTKQYNLVAKIVGGTLSSDARIFTVRSNLVRPVITGIYDQRMVYCPNGGSSGAWFFGDIQGTASPGERVFSVINGMGGFSAVVGADGHFSLGSWNDGGGANMTYTVTVRYVQNGDIESQPYTVRNAG